MSTLKSILLVEDSIEDAELALGALQEDNLIKEIAIVHVRDGADALDYLYCRGEFAARTTGDPSVVFLDLKMPRVDGLEVLNTMKGDGRLKTIPVVMLTSSREEADLVRSYELGVNAYVVKPVEFDSFVRTIREAGIFWALLNEPPPRAPSS